MPHSRFVDTCPNMWYQRKQELLRRRIPVDKSLDQGVISSILHFSFMEHCITQADRQCVHLLDGDAVIFIDHKYAVEQVHRAERQLQMAGTWV